MYFYRGIFRKSSQRIIFIRYFSTGKSLNNQQSLNATSVDSDEIKHLSIYANKWWDKRGILRALHSYNELRVPFIRDCLIDKGGYLKDNAFSSTPLKGVHILEVGCGGGILTEPLARVGAKVTGLDAAQDLIDVAKFHSAKDSEIKDLIDYRLDTIEHFSAECPNKFDAVVCSEVIEHISNKELFLKSTISTLKPGGSIFVTTFDKTFLTWFLGIIIAENVFNAAPRGTHQYDKFISPHELQRMLELNECTTRIIQGMIYNPFTNRWSWTPFKCSYALHAVKD